jgi:nucleotide-binding universal stress UspA family protein
MGTHRRHGWDKFMGGSVAEAVLHVSDRPVLTVPQDSTAGQTATVLCPINFTEAAETAVKAACCLSRALEAELNVVHVAPHDAGQSEMERLEAKVREWLDPLVSQWCEFRQMLARGAEAADRILEWADRIGAGYLVVGARKKAVTHSRAALGTTTEKILRVAPMPVLSVVHPRAEATVKAA